MRCPNNIRKPLSILVFIFVFLSIASSATAQGRKLIILVRHAEKETSEMTDLMDPPLTPAGRERADRLVKRIGKYRPGAIYSTDYKRTRATIEPLAKKRGLHVQIYDAAKPQDLINTIMSGKIKRVVVVGHSNTIPQLANLLTKKEIFKSLEDPEYSVVWMIYLRNGAFSRAKIITY